MEVVGRAAELAVIDSFLDTVSGGFATLVFEGEPGIGKTTLWAEAVRRGIERGYTVLSCRPTSAEATVSYTGVGDLLTSVEDDVYGALPALQRRALDGVLLRGETDGRAPDRRTVSVAVLSVLRALATSPVLVAVDDAQWLDRPSAAVLAFASRRLDGEPLGVVTVVRLSADANGVRTFDRDVAEHRRRAVPVSPMSLGALHVLLTARLGRPGCNAKPSSDLRADVSSTPRSCVRMLLPGRPGEPGERHHRRPVARMQDDLARN